MSIIEHVRRLAELNQRLAEIEEDLDDNELGFVSLTEDEVRLLRAESSRLTEKIIRTEDEIEGYDNPHYEVYRGD